MPSTLIWDSENDKGQGVGPGSSFSQKDILVWDPTNADTYIMEWIDEFAHKKKTKNFKTGEKKNWQGVSKMFNGYLIK